MSNCPLCNHSGILFHQDHRTFYSCDNCLGIFVDRESLPDEKEESNRYASHNNDVEDPGYQNFVLPIVEYVKSKYSTHNMGLDYGAGPGPVISKMLKESGFDNIYKYDPFYHKNESALHQTYDFIICCEVIEHFHHPRSEFQGLFDMLNNNSQLICMTHLYHDNIPFPNWYYKNDPTHVFFYRKETIKFIRDNFGFESSIVEDRLIVLEKGSL